MILVCFSPRLRAAGVDNLGLDGRADGTAGAAKGLDLLDDVLGFLVGNLTEDDVLAVEPRGHNSGDEELGAVAKVLLISSSWAMHAWVGNLRVGAGVGHGEEEGLVVGLLEVLVGELLAVDGATTGALVRVSTMHVL